MRTVILSASVAVLVAAGSLPGAASATMDEGALRCSAARMKKEAQFVGCVADCRKRGAGIHRCEAGCENTYARGLAAVACEADSTEPLTLSELGGVERSALVCRAAMRGETARLRACHAKCQRRALRGKQRLKFRVEQCEDRCVGRHGAALGRLNRRRVCEHVGGSDESEDLQHDPNEPVETIRAMVPTPGGLVEADLEVIDGEAIFEGDIVVGRVEDLLRPGDEHSDGPLGAGRTATSAKWPRRTLSFRYCFSSGFLGFSFRRCVSFPYSWRVTVPYTIAASVSTTRRTWIDDASDEWETKTQVRFVDQTMLSDTERSRDYVTFRDGGRCSSRVGKVSGQQFINIGGCSRSGSVIHEVGHALGLWHEHTRADRNNSVRVIWSNILSGAARNFQTYTSQGFDGADIGTFDFGSIMLYGSYAFSIDRGNLPTIVRRDGTTFTVQRGWLSAGDIAAVTFMYGMSPNNPY